MKNMRIRRDQTTADFRDQNLKPRDAILLALDLSQAGVTGGLTSLDLSNNALCGVTPFGGTYTAEGITAIADSLRVNGGLTSIDLSSNQLCGIWTAEDGFEQFQLGTYTAEGITAIADALGVNGGLTSLNLSSNQLCGLDSGGRGTYTAEGITAIADAMRVNGRLTALDLSSNELKDEGVRAVCEAIQSNKETKLASLNMAMNRIGQVGAKSVAAMVAVTRALTKMSLADNELGEKGIKVICEALEQNFKLKELDISCNSGWTEGAKHVANMLWVNGALMKLSLANNDLGVEGTKLLCDALVSNISLKELDLSGEIRNSSNIGGTAGAKHVAKMLGVNGGLTKISLASNVLGEKGTKAICEALEQNKTLKELDLSGNYIAAAAAAAGGGAAGAKHVAKMLGVNGGLTSLDLSYNELCGLDRHGSGTYTADGITAIADALRVNGALTVTNLLGNQLDAESAKMLADVAKQKGISLCGIQRDQTTADFRYKELQPPDAILLGSDLSQAVVTGALTSINLWGKKLGDEGWGAIFAAICGNTDSKIMCLDASSENISPAGVKLIAEALRTSVTGALTSVGLRGNKLGDKGWGAIFAAICGNKDSKILFLEVSCEDIGPAGGKLIAEALRTSVTGALTKLSLAQNKLEEEGTKAICEALEQNTTLKELDISGGYEGNIGGSAGAKHVAKMLGVNGGLTVANILGNQLDAESAKMLAEVAKQKGISLCGIQRDQATADFCNKRLQPPDAILLASDLSQAVVTGTLTSVDLSRNHLTDHGRDMTGAKELAAALDVNGALTKME
jgi:Ran GTPase-activating protein (RanGAP) involved in mRNA processing and transport